MRDVDVLSTLLKGVRDEWLVVSVAPRLNEALSDLRSGCPAAMVVQPLGGKVLLYDDVGGMISSLGRGDCP